MLSDAESLFQTVIDSICSCHLQPGAVNAENFAVISGLSLVRVASLQVRRLPGEL